MFIIYLYYNACMYGGGLKEMPCFRTHIKLVERVNLTLHEPLVRNLTPQFLIHVLFLLHFWIDLAVLLLLETFFLISPIFD